jgi:hypothetical protein
MPLAAERRQTTRFPFNADLTVRPLASLYDPCPHSTAVHGTILDISAGGLKLAMDSSIAVTGLVRCELLLPQIPVPITLLTQLRWTSNQRIEGQYHAGLQFLLLSDSPT